MASQPTYYFGFNFVAIGQPSIVVTHGAFVYAALNFGSVTKYLLPFTATPGAGAIDVGAPAGFVYNSFAAALQTALNAAAATAGDGATWTVAWKADTLRFTISVSAGTFTAVLNPLAQALLGTTTNIAATSSFSSSITPRFVKRPTVDAWRRDKPDYEPPDVGSEEETDDGDAVGVARTVVPIYTDISQLFEPKASVFKATGSTVWTWEEAWAHARHIEPIVLVKAPWNQATITYGSADIEMRGRWRLEGANFDPQPHVAKSDQSGFYLKQKWRVTERP